MRNLTLLAAIIGTFALAGCNTVKGVGHDMEKAGSKISEAAENTGGTGTN
ncbi:MAG: entericidin A/B family lipoprotein [Cardiobacteriaceae bacterium]|nr:entericidin A/B family lipoprotein [Cardiobacteriaceae bacterium]